MIVRPRNRCHGDEIDDPSSLANEDGNGRGGGGEYASCGSGCGVGESSADNRHDESMRPVSSAKANNGAVRLIAAFFVRAIRPENGGK